MGLTIADLHYDLPDELIAQTPAERRQDSRMLVVDRGGDSFADMRFADLPSLLNDGDLLVLNNTKVFPARLFGNSETGAGVEIFLVRETGQDQWEALARPARRLKTGKKVIFGDRLTGTIEGRTDDGKVIIRFCADGDLDEILDEIGKTPLPPYIKRERDRIDTDRERYQTVYAKNRGAIAAPTAGLHFTQEIIEKVRERGVTVAEITLHVGYGTFEPVRAEDLSRHRVLAETYEIDAAAAETLKRASADGRRIVAVGTTTTRALESNIAEFGTFTAGRRSADLTITPGYRFRAVGALLTNFHLPASSLLVLTSTFGGHQLIMSAYRHAVAERYRFYSYGDCMLIV